MKRALPAAASELEKDIYRAVESLQPGEVVSYGDIAARAGHPGTARQVGRCLKRAGDALPWWRVVYADGFLPPCNPTLQAQRLIAEGAELQGTRVITAPQGRFRSA